MTDAQIEKEALHYSIEVMAACNEKCERRHIQEAFEAGAKWRINSVYHPKEDVPEMGKEIMTESIMLAGRESCKVKMMNDREGWKENNSIKRWVYTKDILPD